MKKKNPHAAAPGRLGGNARKAALSQDERTAIAVNAGAPGGRKRAQTLSARRRSEIARQAARSRWAK